MTSVNFWYQFLCHHPYYCYLKVRRTVKFLCGLAGGQVIVLPSWLEACKKAKGFVGKNTVIESKLNTSKEGVSF